MDIVLPEGWTTAYSKSNKKNYYVHEETGRRQYEIPNNEIEQDRINIRKFYTNIPKDFKSDKQSWRGFNNFMKQSIMEEFSSDLRVDYMNDFEYSVLDIGCGTGGDIGKWNRLGATSYLGFDNCQSSINELKNRNYSNFEMNVDAFCGDFTSPETWSRIPEKKFDIISCQFAAHYAFSDKLSLRSFFSGISKSLTDRGRVIIITVDADKWRCHKKKNWGPAKISNVNELKKDYGDRYLFELDDRVSAPEWWVHSNVLQGEVEFNKLEFSFSANLASLANWFGVDSVQTSSQRQSQWLHSHEKALQQMCPIIDAQAWSVISLYKLYYLRVPKLVSGNSVIKDFQEWIESQNSGNLDALTLNL